MRSLMLKLSHRKAFLGATASWIARSIPLALGASKAEATTQVQILPR